jgi:hypothetical protein
VQIWGRKKMEHSKTSKEGIWFCPTKAPPSFLVFLFLSLHLALLFYVPLMAIMLVMTTPPTCCHFAIACIGSGHQEEKGKQGGLFPPHISGVMIALACNHLQQL